MVDLSKVKTYPIAQRKNLVTLSDFVRPEDTRISWDNEDFGRLCRSLARGRPRGRRSSSRWARTSSSAGSAWCSRDLMERGFISHLAMNGACVVHDFEIALIGETSEDVADSIENGSFGMAEETGRFINETVNASAEGFGKALGRRISRDKLPHRDHSVLCRAFAPSGSSATASPWTSRSSWASTARPTPSASWSSSSRSSSRRSTPRPPDKDLRAAVARRSHCPSTAGRSANTSASRSSEMNPELAEAWGAKDGYGLLVTALEADGAAKKAGLKVGDIILKADGKKVETVNDLSGLLQDKKKGDKVKIEFVRDKKTVTADVGVGEDEIEPKTSSSAVARRSPVWRP